MRMQAFANDLEIIREIEYTKGKLYYPIMLRAKFKRYIGLKIL